MLLFIITLIDYTLKKIEPFFSKQKKTHQICQPTLLYTPPLTPLTPQQKFRNLKKDFHHPKKNKRR